MRRGRTPKYRGKGGGFQDAKEGCRKRKKQPLLFVGGGGGGFGGETWGVLLYDWLGLGSGGSNLSVCGLVMVVAATHAREKRFGCVAD